jgi:hypothetical protein
MHSAFLGTKPWPEARLGMDTPPRIFDAAIRVLCQFATVGQTASRSGNVVRHIDEYFRSLTFPQLNDLLYAVRIARHTHPNYRTNNFFEFHKFCVSSGGDPFFDACDSIEQVVLDAILEVVWRNPNSFPRTNEFHHELLQRAALCWKQEFDLTEWTLEEIRDELSTLSFHFENLKIDSEMAYHVWLDFAFLPSHLFPGDRATPVSRTEMKNVRKALRRGQWPSQVAEAFDAYASNVQRILRHLVLWGRRTGTSGMEMPQFSGGQPPRK